MYLQTEVKGQMQSSCQHPQYSAKGMQSLFVIIFLSLEFFVGPHDLKSEHEVTLTSLCMGGNVLCKYANSVQRSQVISSCLHSILLSAGIHHQVQETRVCSDKQTHMYVCIYFEGAVTCGFGVPLNITICGTPVWMVFRYIFACDPW